MSKKRPKKTEQPVVIDRKPRDIRGKLCCGACQEPFTVTSTGMLCNCPKIVPYHYTYRWLEINYPSQISVSRADSMATELKAARS